MSASAGGVGDLPKAPGKGVDISMEWVTPDFEEVETSAEVTAYAGHW